MLLTDLIYYLYENRLMGEVRRRGEMPQHVGLILDGNRRYAQVKGWKNAEGHRMGADKIDDVVKWCEELEIPILTLWALSTENLSRNQDELQRLLQIIETKITALASDPVMHQRKMRIRPLGRVDLLPESTQKVLQDAAEATAGYEDFQLNIALGYGGRQEIIDAVKDLLVTEASKGKSVEEIADGLSGDEIRNYLYTFDMPDPDLIIRTSGEVRMSGFLLWQSAYSEFYFCDVYWPEFRRIDFLRAIRSYQARKRRFGK